MMNIFIDQGTTSKAKQRILENENQNEKENETFTCDDVSWSYL